MNYKQIQDYIKEKFPGYKNEGIKLNMKKIELEQYIEMKEGEETEIEEFPEFEYENVEEIE